MGQGTATTAAGRDWVHCTDSILDQWTKLLAGARTAQLLGDPFGICKGICFGKLVPIRLIPAGNTKRYVSVLIELDE